MRLQVFTSLGDSQKGLSHLHTLKKTVNNGSQNEKGQVYVCITLTLMDWGVVF